MEILIEKIWNRKKNIILFEKGKKKTKKTDKQYPL